MNKYVPLHVHTDASLSDGISKPKQVAEKIKLLDLPACAITDHGSLSNCIKFYKEMTSLGLKPILGCEFYVCNDDSTIKENENRKLHHLILLAKNYTGWKSLIKTVSEANKKENYYYKPRLDLDKISEFANNIIAIDGHYGSILSSKLLNSDIPNCKTEQQVRQYVNKSWYNECVSHIRKMQEIFGNENFYLECQLIDKDTLPQSLFLTKAMRYFSEKLNLKKVATCDAHYVNKEDAQLQRIFLCTSMNITLSDVYEKNKNNMCFFFSDNYHIPSYNEMTKNGHTQDELESTLEIAEKCSQYSLKNPPLLPKIENSHNILVELCRKGWVEKIEEIRTNAAECNKTIEDYENRVRYELGVIEQVGLADYFLVVHDIINFYKESGHITSPGRGSSAGSIVLWLIGVTRVDPIKYDLIFERFFNQARYIPDCVSFDECNFMDFIGLENDNN